MIECDHNFASVFERQTIKGFNIDSAEPEKFKKF